MCISNRSLYSFMKYACHRSYLDQKLVFLSCNSSAYWFVSLMTPSLFPPPQDRRRVPVSASRPPEEGCLGPRPALPAPQCSEPRRANRCSAPHPVSYHAVGHLWGSILGFAYARILRRRYFFLRQKKHLSYVQWRRHRFSSGVVEVMT